MKRLFLIAAAALVVLAGCKGKTAAEVLAEYRESVEKIEQAYYAAVVDLDEDAADQLLENTIAQLVDNGRKLLRK